MARYLVECNCGNRVPVEVGQAGGRVACTCGSMLDVPQLRKLRHLPLADVQTGRTASRWSARHGLVAVSLMAIVGLVAANIWSKWTEPAVPRFDPDAYQRTVDQGLQNITPAVAWNLWLNYRMLAERGFPIIDVANRPAIERQIAHRQAVRRTLWITAGIFTAIAAAAAFWRKQTQRRTRQQN